MELPEPQSKDTKRIKQGGLPSGNQTGQWEIPMNWYMNGKISCKWAITHSYVNLLGNIYYCSLDPDSLLKMIWEDFGGPPGGNHIA